MSDSDPLNDSVGQWVTNAAPAAPGAGTEIERFLLEQPLGRGGMGEVWKAYDAVGERYVALKLVPPILASHPAEMQRVKETFQRIHALQHQHICPVYLLGKDAHFGYFVVMKFLDARTLGEYRIDFVRRNGSFPLNELVKVLRPVAEALDYAHANNVVHRDVKPQNILVGRDNIDVQVVDFGLAAEVRTSITRVSQVRMDSSGTYPYMAPEQWRGQFQDARTDQYALGVVAYELLAGRLPFDAPDDFVLRQCVLNEEVARLPNQPDYVNAALSQALAKDRDSRFDHCVSLVQALSGQQARVSAVATEETEQDKSNDGTGAPTPPSHPENSDRTVGDLVLDAEVLDTPSPPTRRPPDTSPVRETQATSPPFGAAPGIHCRHCGKLNRSADAYCSSCGSYLRGSTGPASHAYAYSQPMLPPWSFGKSISLVITNALVFAFFLAAAAAASELLTTSIVEAELKRSTTAATSLENRVVGPTVCGAVAWGGAGFFAALITSLVGSSRIPQFGVLSVLFWLAALTLAFSAAGGVPAFVLGIRTIEQDHVFRVSYGAVIVGIAVLAMTIYELGCARAGEKRPGGWLAMFVGMILILANFSACAWYVYDHVDDLERLIKEKEREMNVPRDEAA